MRCNNPAVIHCLDGDTHLQLMCVADGDKAPCDFRKDLGAAPNVVQCVAAEIEHHARTLPTRE